MSLLEIDHLVPRKVGNSLWYTLSSEERRVLQVTLLVRTCKQCNNGKLGKLLPRAELEKRYVNAYFEGERAAAVVDARWAILETVLTKVYKARAVG